MPSTCLPAVLPCDRAHRVADQTKPGQHLLMRSVNIQQAKTHLSRLLEDAARGEEIVIAKAGKPYVRLVPYSEDDQPRKLGAWQGKMWIAPDFDRTPDELNELFEGVGVIGEKREKRAKRATRPRDRKDER